MTIYTINIAFGTDKSETDADEWAPTLVKAVENDVKESFKIIEMLKKSKAPPMEECKGENYKTHIIDDPNPFLIRVMFHHYRSLHFFSQRMQFCGE